MNKISISLLAAFAFGTLAPTMATAQAAHDGHPKAQPTHTSRVMVKKSATVKKTTIRTGGDASKKVTCHYSKQGNKQVKVCK